MVTRVQLLTATFMVLAAGLPAAAADVGRLPMKAPVAAPVQVQDWTGLYVGANAGYSWGRTDVDHTLGGVPTLGTTLDPNSFVGGGGNRSGGPPSRQRHKYKSAFLKRTFSKEEASCFYRHLTREVPGIDLSGTPCSATPSAPPSTIRTSSKRRQHRSAVPS